MGRKIWTPLFLFWKISKNQTPPFIKVGDFNFFLKKKLGFTQSKAVQPLRGMELQEKKKHKKHYRIQKICLERTYS